MNGTPTQMQPSVAAEASSGEAFEPATVARRSRFISYRSYLLVLLILIHAIVLTERFALSISLQSIKRDMGLSDTLLGLMSGLAFTVFYAAMGIPIGLWADRGSRVKVVSVTMFIWGVMVALCGAVGNFVQLLLVRVGVAIGEAGGLTPSYSLISEHFGRAERPRALGLFALGAPISLLISFLAAGWLNQTYGWRTMFVVIASPGVVLAILAAATLRDPRSSKSQTSAQPLRNDTAPSVLDVVAYLGRNRTFRRMVLATSLNFFFLYALFQWQPTFFGRSFGMTSLQIRVIFQGAAESGAYRLRNRLNDTRLNRPDLSQCVDSADILLADRPQNPTPFDGRHSGPRSNVEGFTRSSDRTVYVRLDCLRHGCVKFLSA